MGLPLIASRDPTIAAVASYSSLLSAPRTRVAAPVSGSPGPTLAPAPACSSATSAPRTARRRLRDREPAGVEQRAERGTTAVERAIASATPFAALDLGDDDGIATRDQRPGHGVVGEQAIDGTEGE